VRGRVLAAALACAALLGACGKKEGAAADAGAGTGTGTGTGTGGGEAPKERFSEEGMLAEGRLYLDDAAFRRKTLEESLVNHANTYSRQRLDSYGLGSRGWDLLPEWNPRSVPITTAMVAELRAGRPLHMDPAAPPLWDGKRPTTMAGWVALGREVFLGYPLRVEVYMKWALEHPEMGERIGIKPAADGTYPGARLFVDVDGTEAVGITCAVCHTTVDGSGKVTVGEARRVFDYGALRIAYHEATKTRLDPELARRMRTWGPGRADVTEDDDEDPVAVPDLWGLRHQTFLTQAGTIRHVGPTALAIRQETQLLHSNHQKIRPPRELAFALAMFLYSLEPPPATLSSSASASASASARAGAGASAGKGAGAVTAGHALFEKHCSSCHSNPAFGGPSIPAAKVGTDKALAEGGARGTGRYRPAALIRVSAAAPYFHHGAVPTLEDVLAPERLEASYARSPLGRGPVPGHAFGTSLPRGDRDALVAYLRTL